MRVKKTADHFVERVMPGVGGRGIIKIAVGRQAFAPFLDEPVDLVPARDVTRGREHPREAAYDLAENVEGVAAVPSPQVGPRGGTSGTLSKALEKVVVGNGQIFFFDRVELVLETAAVQDNPFVSEGFQGRLALGDERADGGA